MYCFISPIWKKFQDLHSSGLSLGTGNVSLSAEAPLRSCITSHHTWKGSPDWGETPLDFPRSPKPLTLDSQQLPMWILPAHQVWVPSSFPVPDLVPLPVCRTALQPDPQGLPPPAPPSHLRPHGGCHRFHPDQPYGRHPGTGAGKCLCGLNLLPGFCNFEGP